MRIALLADVHSNLEALLACLADARARGADAYAFLGDLVGYGADPCAVLDVVATHVAQGAIAVRGNHDEAALTGNSESMNQAAAEAIAWTRPRLSRRHLELLDALPLTVRRDDALYVHASASSPKEWAYVTGPVEAAHSLAAARATYVFCGHVHEPTLYFLGAAGRPLPFEPVPGVAIPVPARRQWLAIAGAVGQPRSGLPSARYAIMDRDAASITFLKVAYDWRTAAAKVRAAGLAERLALRLERGK
jgi:diadenosine tetraphosphatase ApaH/serine/threonine PP2A family protein phosphatase